MTPSTQIMSACTVVAAHNPACYEYLMLAIGTGRRITATNFSPGRIQKSTDLWGRASFFRGQQVSGTHEVLSNHLSAEHLRDSCLTSEHLRLKASECHTPKLRASESADECVTQYRAQAGFLESSVPEEPPPAQDCLLSAVLILPA